jgi:hypothetical protein
LVEQEGLASAIDASPFFVWRFGKWILRYSQDDIMDGSLRQGDIDGLFGAMIVIIDP